MTRNLQLATSSIEWRRVGDEIVILNTATARYLTLNKSGADLWSLLTEGTDDAALAAGLVERYEISPEEAHSDVTAFIAELDDHGLLETGRNVAAQTD